MKSNTPIILAGLALAILGFVGVLLFGQVVNPPPTPIMVALADIPPGAVLSREMLGIDDARLNRQVIAGLVLESELDQFLGGTVIEPVHAYQPLPKAAIVAGGNPAAANRLALTLSDPALVAMVVPVNPETAPQNVAVGDYVDLNFGVGAATFLAGTLSTAPTPPPFAEFLPTPVVLETAPPTATPEPPITLPIAKTIVKDAKVLAVVYDEQPNPAYAGPESGESLTIRGDILALVLTVPREAQELVHFGIVNGSIRIALLSPNAEMAGDQPRQPTLGMSWDDLEAIFRLDRDQALASGQPAELIGPGAAAVWATQQAAEAALGQSIAGQLTAQPTATPFVTATATP